MDKQPTIRAVSNRADTLQNVILEAFTCVQSDTVSGKLAQFSLRDWRRLGTWLDASGLALYFLEEMCSRGLVRVLPRTVLATLQQNQADNRDRTDALMQEFMRLNVAFQAEKFDYLNVKGFTLGREYCSKPALRSQFDLDFWLREGQAARCVPLMETMGYKVCGRTATTLEFRAGESHYPTLSEFYKPRIQRAVEIHLRPAEQMARIVRQNGVLGGQVFPALSREQIFILHSVHLAKHIRSEWTRASWMLELRNAIQNAYADSDFWDSVREQSTAGGSAMSIGIAVLAVSRVFRLEIPSALGSWSVEPLPKGVVRWLYENVERCATAQFPGTKLYLLLERELAKDDQEYKRRRHVAVLPLRLPGLITASRAGRRSSIRYIGMRIAFHVRENFRLMRAERDWANRVDAPHASVLHGGGGIT